MINTDTESASRYDRIDRVTGVTPNYKTAKIRLIISEKLVRTYNGQVMFIIAVNLIARWAYQIHLIIPENTSCVIKKYRGKLFESVVRDIILSVDSSFKFSINDFQALAEYKLIIGESTEPLSIWIDCDGWLAGYGYDTSNNIKEERKQSVLGACLAACLGVSELFRQAVGETKFEFQKWFSLYDYSFLSNKTDLLNIELPGSINLGTIHQIGCGAIGSSFDFILSLVEDIDTNLQLIDYDHIEAPNLPASLIFSELDVKMKTKKVDACAKIFNAGVIATPFSGDYEKYINVGEYKKHVPDILLCFANDKNIWATIQHKCPPITFHATTNKTWGTNFGRHIPEKDWCIMCRFHNEVKQVAPLICSEGNISIDSDVEILGILPFLASTSAVITLAEMFKLQLQKNYLLSPNFVEFSMRKSNGRFIAYSRPSKECETCKEQDPGIYPTYVKNTKYWYLSEP